MDTTINSNTASGNSPGLGGGGIFVDDGLTLSLNNTVTISDNVADATAGNGGGIHNRPGAGLAAVINTTISGNIVTNGDGGGIWNAGAAGVVNSTISGNTTTTGEGGGFGTPAC